MKKKKTESITKVLTNTLRDYQKRSSSKAKLMELFELKEEMSSKGLLKKQAFELPLVDTVGRTAYSSSYLAAYQTKTGDSRGQN